MEHNGAGRLNAIEGTSQGLEIVSGKWTSLVVFVLKHQVDFTLLNILYAICHQTDDHRAEMQTIAQQFQEKE